MEINLMFIEYYSGIIRKAEILKLGRRILPYTYFRNKIAKDLLEDLETYNDIVPKELRNKILSKEDLEKLARENICNRLE